MIPPAFEYLMILKIKDKLLTAPILNQSIQLLAPEESLQTLS